MRYKVSGAIAVPKASWGCAPALPNRMQTIFPRIKQNDHNVFVDDSVIVLFQTSTPALDNSTEIQYNKGCIFRRFP